MSTSRVMPPAVAVAHDMTNTPNRSSRCLTPATAPLRANTNVPASSSTMSVPAVYALNAASVCRTCSAPDVGTMLRAVDSAREPVADGLHLHRHGRRRANRYVLTGCQFGDGFELS